MAYNIVVGVTPAPGALSAIDRVEQGLDNTTQAATKATDALKGTGAAGQEAAAGLGAAGASAKGAADGFEGVLGTYERMKSTLDRIHGPWKEYEHDLQAATLLMQGGKLTTGEYEAELGRLQDRLQSIERYSMAPELKREADILEQIQGPLRAYEAQLKALDSLLAKEQISLVQYESALAKVQRRAESAGAIGPVQGPAFDPNKAGRGLDDELKRQEEILQQLQAPMKEYEAQLKALDALLQKNEIDLIDYNREMERAEKAAGRGLGPVQGPKQQTPGAPPGKSDDSGHGGGRAVELVEAVAPKFGAAGELFGGLATKGTIATVAVVALATEIVHLGDEYIVLANKARKVTEAGGSIDETLQQQLALSKELHGSIDATIELYDAVRDGTDELNLSQRQQVGLAREIGQAVLAEGKSIEQAEGLMKRLTYSFASGAITGRDLKSIMREFPDIGAAFVTAMGHSRNELVLMANKGQISAEMLIDSFRKMNKEMAEKVDKQVQTSSQHWQHFKDMLLVEIPHAAGVAADAIHRAAHESALANAANETGIDPDEIRRQEEAIEQQGRSARIAREQAEATRLLTGEQEKNAKTAQLAGLAGNLGIEFGDFSEESANAIAALRIQLGQFGVDTGDAFEKAHGRASLFGRKLEEIQERKDAEKIAEDVQRIYDAMHGVDDLLEDQEKHWKKLSDDVTKFSGAISMLQAKRFVSGASKSQDERDLDLQLANAKTEQSASQYGKGMVGYAQGINTARAELEALNRAAHDGEIKGAALRSKYDALMATLNDGRLPEAIKIWESIHDPIEQAERDFRALNALFRIGRLDVSEYTSELKKIADTGKSDDARILEAGIERLNQSFDRGELTLRTYDAAVVKLNNDFAMLHKTSSGISYRIAPEGPSGPSGLLPRAQQQLYAPSVTNSDEMRKILAQYQSTELIPEASENFKQLNEELERANRLADEFVEPAVKYEQRLKDIDGALSLNSITEDKATAARRRARDAFDQETEALEAQKGPMEAYAAALRKLQDQLDARNISQRQYAQGIDRAKEAMLQATGDADTFAGAMQLHWIKMKQEADRFGAAVADQLVGDFDKLNDAIVTAANGGEVSFSQMADSMIQDLERIALKMLEVKLVSSLFGLFSGGGGAAGLADTGIGMEGWEGYATGGSFLVGGDGGIDSTPVAFRATRGERVTITTPGAYPYPAPASGGQGGGGGGNAAPVVRIINNYDSAVSQAALDGPGGQASIMNTLRLKTGPLRTLTSRPRRA